MHENLSQDMLDFINKLNPELMDNLLKQNLGRNTFNRHRLNHKEFQDASNQNKLLFLIDSFSWAYSTPSRQYWEHIYSRISKAKKQEDLYPYISEDTMVKRTMIL